MKELIDLLIAEHRVNTIEHLKRIPHDRGVEVDIRDYDGALRLCHDPFVRSEEFEEYLKHYNHSMIILNVKCDGLEDYVLSLMKKYKIKNYFFLDVTNPSLIRLALRGIREVAVRYSEFEPIESALAFAGKVDWVWVDCWTYLPLDVETHKLLKKHFKIYIVSPELQGHPRSMIPSYRKQIKGLPIDAVCTDFCEDWMEMRDKEYG